MISTYPYRVEREHSYSSNPRIQTKVREHNAICAKIENWINEQIRNGRKRVVYYEEVNRVLCLPAEFLGRKVMIDGGHNGFTIDPDIQVR